MGRGGVGGANRRLAAALWAVCTGDPSPTRDSFVKKENAYDDKRSLPLSSREEGVAIGVEDDPGYEKNMLMMASLADWRNQDEDQSGGRGKTLSKLPA